MQFLLAPCYFYDQCGLAWGSVCSTGTPTRSPSLDHPGTDQKANDKDRYKYNYNDNDIDTYKIIHPGTDQPWAREHIDDKYMNAYSIHFLNFKIVGGEIPHFPFFFAESVGKNIVYHFPNKIFKILLRIWLTRNLLVKPLTRVTIRA